MKTARKEKESLQQSHKQKLLSSSSAPQERSDYQNYYDSYSLVLNHSTTGIPPIFKETLAILFYPIYTNLNLLLYTMHLAEYFPSLPFFEERMVNLNAILYNVRILFTIYFQ